MWFDTLRQMSLPFSCHPGNAPTLLSLQWVIQRQTELRIYKKKSTHPHIITGLLCQHQILANWLNSNVQLSTEMKEKWDVSPLKLLLSSAMEKKRFLLFCMQSDQSYDLLLFSCAMSSGMFVTSETTHQDQNRKEILFIGSEKGSQSTCLSNFTHF